MASKLSTWLTDLKEIIEFEKAVNILVMLSGAI